MAVANLNIGDIYLKKNEPGPAIPYLQDAIPGFENGAEAGLDASSPLNFLGKAHLELNDLGLAESFYNQGLSVARESKNVSEESKALIGLGNLANRRANHLQAIEYFESGLELARKTGVLYDQEEAYQGLAEANSSINNYQSAYSNFQEYFRVYDSIRNADMVRSLGFARVEFEADQMEKENELLKTQNTLNEVQIEQAKRDEQLYLIIMGLFLAIIAGFVFQYFYIRRTNKRLAFERNRSDQILLNILPKETADELKENGFVKTQELDQVTVLFTDFKAFSTVAERISAEELIRSVDYYFKNFDEITERHNVEKIKTIGDAYMCAGGLPHPNTTHAHDTFRAALEIRDFVLKTEMNPPKGIYPFKIRIGLNTGPVVSGVVGTKKFAYDIWGNTVNIAARMESGSVPGRINVSENTYQLLKDDYDFTYRGEIEVKNGLMLKMYFSEVQEAVPA